MRMRSSLVKAVIEGVEKLSEREMEDMLDDVFRKVFGEKW